MHPTLSTAGELCVVGVVQDGEAAVDLARAVEPDVVLMDIELLGEMNGIEAALRIKEDRPKTGVVILSTYNRRHYITSLPQEESIGWP